MQRPVGVAVTATMKPMAVAPARTGRDGRRPTQVRGRVQDLVDRRFNPRRYNAARTVEAFAARLREQVDQDALSAELLAVVDPTVAPTRASLWLRPSASSRPPT